MIYLHLFKKEFAVFETNDGLKIKIRVNSTDLMALTNVWLIQEYYSENFRINDNDIIIDIGSHIGLFALFATQFCKNGKIFCYEPIKENYDLLVENISLNQISNIFTFNIAVAKESKPIKIFLNDDESGHSMFLQSENFVRVNSTSLHEILHKNSIENCNFLKIDCEGAEYEIINSLSVDDFNKIQNIVMEYHFAESKPNLIEQLKEEIKNINFEIFITKPHHNDMGFLMAKKAG